MKENNEKNRVAVAMSGGVDSSVAAMLLKKQGYDVHGFFMRNWSELSDIDNFCPWQKDYEDVRRVCQHLGIPYGTFNFEKEYKDRVLNYFLSEYQAGRTPNPDVLCNSEIKFNLFLDKVKSLGFQYMATGHYAKTQTIADATRTSADIRLVNPKDSEKDQTYFLCRLTAQQLENVIFPLADLTKSEVRAIAKEAGLPNAEKKDSQGICFIGKLPVREFLKRNIKVTEGKVLATDGRILGSHEGSQLYAIGQRHIGVAANGAPVYVIEKDVKENVLVMGEEEKLFSNEVSFKHANWFARLPENFECEVQIRYRTKTIPAKITFQHSPEYENVGVVKLETPARAVTPGQYLAFYKDNALIGSAVIA